MIVVIPNGFFRSNSEEKKKVAAGYETETAILIIEQSRPIRQTNSAFVGAQANLIATYPFRMVVSVALVVGVHFSISFFLGFAVFLEKRENRTCDK